MRRLSVATGLYRHASTLAGLIALAFGALLWLFVTRTLADPDLWGHLRFGLDMLAARAVHINDSYSFTSDRVWVNHEWLSELLMGLAYTCFGVAGLNLLKLAAIGLVAGVVAAVSGQERATVGSRNLLMGLTVLATYTRMQVIRPQLFAVATFVVLLYLLRQVDRGRLRAIWGVPVCIVCWANLHGSWIIGLAVVGAWIAAAAGTEGRRDRTILVTAGVASLVATLVNPYGVGLWRFIIETVRFARVDITEWQPLLALPPLILAIEAILPALAVVSVLLTRERVPVRYVAILLLVWVAALKVGRVDAFAQAAVAILLAGPILRGMTSIGRRLDAPFWRAPIRLGAIPALVVAAVGLAGTWQMREIRVDGAWIPDYGAAMFLRDRLPGTRLLTWFNWGEYAIWHLGPAGIRVSMDGRRETVYSADVLARHWTFYRGEHGALDYPDSINADVIWLPADLPVVDLLRARGWSVAFESSRSIVFVRHASRTNGQVAWSAPSDRPSRFPWP